MTTDQAERKFSRSQVNKAGEILCGTENNVGSVPVQEILSYWRTLHAEPLEALRKSLEPLVYKLESKAVITHRLKTERSIIYKLKRSTNTDLARMQDLGGMRIVVSNLKTLYRIKQLVSEKKFSEDFEFLPSRCRDYIERPKDDGYRSLHLIFRYLKKTESNNLEIELQIRTKTQHNWSTTLETVDTFHQLDIKRGINSPEWSDFFKLTSSVLAETEGATRLEEHNTMSRSDLFKLFTEKYKSGILTSLSYRGKLNVIKKVVDTPSHDSFKKGYFLVSLKKSIVPFQSRWNLTVKHYSSISDGARAYSELEQKRGPQDQVVLVSLENIAGLAEAYPNYLLDIKSFISQLDGIVKMANSQS